MRLPPKKKQSRFYKQPPYQNFIANPHLSPRQNIESNNSHVKSNQSLDIYEIKDLQSYFWRKPSKVVTY